MSVRAMANYFSIFHEKHEIVTFEDLGHAR
jgi:hypothetical protein